MGAHSYKRYVIDTEHDSHSGDAKYIFPIALSFVRSHVPFILFVDGIHTLTYNGKKYSFVCPEYELLYKKLKSYE